MTIEKNKRQGHSLVMAVKTAKNQPEVKNAQRDLSFLWKGGAPQARLPSDIEAAPGSMSNL